MLTCLLPIVDKIVEHPKYNNVDVVEPLYFIVVVFEEKQYSIKCTESVFKSKQVGTNVLCDVFLDIEDKPVIFELA